MPRHRSRTRAGSNRLRLTVTTSVRPPPAPSSHSIAVIMPAFNAADLIGDALESVARQRRLPDELVVVDDGSTDGTADVVGRWAETAAVPVTLLRQPNRGLSASRNRATLATTSSLIATLDADDVWMPGHLELLESAFRLRDDLVLAFGNGRRVLMEGRVGTDYHEGKDIERLAYSSLVPPGTARPLRLLEESPFSSLLEGSYIPVSGNLYSRAAAMEIGNWDEGFGTTEDRDFFLRLSRSGRVAYTPEIVVTVRYHGQNLTSRTPESVLARDRLAVVRRALARRRELELSTSEVGATRAAVRRHEHVYLRSASTDGLSGYARAVGHLTRSGSLRWLAGPRALARAVRASVAARRDRR